MSKLSLGRAIGAAVLLGPLCVATFLSAGLLLGALSSPEPNTFFQVAEFILAIIAGAYFVGFLPALVSGVIFGVLQKRIGAGYLCASLSGGLGMLGLMLLFSFPVRPYDVSVATSMILTFGVAPAILTTTVATKMGWFPKTAAQGVKVPITWVNGILLGLLPVILDKTLEVLI